MRQNPDHRKARQRLPHRAQRGVTLIELVVTIAVGSAVVAFMALFIVGPMNAYSAQARRAELVDDADSALRFIERDGRQAWPASVRVASSGTIVALEMLATVDGARYRDSGPLSDPTRELDFTAADGAFATTVPFTQLSLPYTSAANYLSIYNVGVPGAGQGDDRAAPRRAGRPRGPRRRVGGHRHGVVPALRGLHVLSGARRDLQRRVFSKYPFAPAERIAGRCV